MSTAERPTDDWTEPGTYEVAPNVYRIPLPLPSDGLKAVNVYVISDGNALTLVDSGWALSEARVALERGLNVLGATLGDVHQFLVTHVHRDHYTHAVALRDIYGTPISLGAGERPTLEALADPEFKPMDRQISALRSHGADEVIGRLLAGEPTQVRTMEHWKPPDMWLTDRQEIRIGSRTLEVINTPGHTRGHVVFADPGNGLLFAGDHVLPHITPSIGFEPASGGFPLLNYIDSLRLIRRLPEMSLFPAHGAVSASVHERVDELLAHHDQRLSEAFASVCNGATTAFDAASQLGWTRRKRPFITLDPFNQMLAVFETASHLDLLVLQGRLAIRTISGVTIYEVVPS